MQQKIRQIGNSKGIIIPDWFLQETKSADRATVSMRLSIRKKQVTLEFKTKSLSKPSSNRKKSKKSRGAGSRFAGK